MNQSLELALRILTTVEGAEALKQLAGDNQVLIASIDQLREHAVMAYTPYAQMADAARSWGSGIAETVTPAASAADALLKVAAGATTVATAVGVLAYNESREYESALKELSKVLSSADGDVSQYTDSIDKLAIKYGESANVLTKSMANFAQSGFSATTALGLVEEALDVVRAGDVEAAKASELLIATLKGFDVPANNVVTVAQRLGDIWNEVSNRYATNTEQLATAMAQLAPIARQAGLSLEETAGFATPIIEVFRSGSEAADALKMGLLKLTDDSAPVREALRSIGVDQKDMNGNLRSGRDILLDVAVAFQNLDGSTKLAVASQLVGIEQSGRMIKVFDGLAKGLEVTATAANSYGSQQAEVEKVLASSDVIVARSIESFRQLATTLGTQFQKPINGLVDATGLLARQFDEAARAGSFDGLVAVVSNQLAAVEQLFRDMAANIPEALAAVDFTPLIGAIHQLGGSVADAFARITQSTEFLGANIAKAMDFRSVEGLRGTFQLLADGVAALTRMISGNLDGMGPLLESYGKWARVLLDSAGNVAYLAGELAGMAKTIRETAPLWGAIAGELLDFISNATTAALAIWGIRQAVLALNAAGISVLPILGNIASSLARLPLAAAGFLGLAPAWLALASAAGVAGYAVGGAVNSLIDAATAGRGLGVTLYEAAEGFTDYVNTIVDSLTGGRGIGAPLYELVEALGLVGDEAVSTVPQIDAATAAQQRAAKAAEEAAKQQRAAKAAADEQAQSQERLAKTFEAAGLQWDASTGRIVKASSAMGGVKAASLDVQNALRELDVSYAALSDGITETGESAIRAFRKIANDATTNAKLTQAALSAALGKAETKADIAELEREWMDYAQRVGMSAEHAATAFKQAHDAAKDTAKEALDAAEQETRQVGLSTQAKIDNARAAVAIARASGDEAEVRRAVAALAKAEAEQSRAVAAAKSREAEAAKALAASLASEATAKGDSSDATRKLITDAEAAAKVKEFEAQSAAAAAREKEAEAKAAARASVATKEHTQAANDSAAAAEQQGAAYRNVAAIGAEMSGKLHAAREDVRQLSDAAAQYFEQAFAGARNLYAANSIYGSELPTRISKTTDEIERLNYEIAQQREILGKADAWAAFGDSFSDYEAALMRALAETKIAYSQQKDIALELEKQLGNTGQAVSLQLSAVTNAARAINGELGLLNENDLSRLRGALDAANERLREMQELAATAAERLSELKAENLELSGNKEQADLLRLQNEYTQDALVLEAELAKAKASNNRDAIRDLEQSINLLKQNLDLKERDIRAENSSGKNKSTNSDNDATDSKSTGKSKSSNGSGGVSQSGGGVLSADELAAALKRAGVVGGGIDYERLATAMAQRPIAIDERALTSSVLRTLKNDSMRSS